MRRVFWILIFPLASLLLIWAMTSLLIAPQIEKWALHEIESFSHEKVPFTVKAGAFQIRLLRPSVALNDVEITPKGELAESLKMVKARRVRIFVDFFQLLSGKLALSAVVIRAPVVEINLDPLMKNQGPPQSLPLNDLFNQLEQLPLKRVLLQNLNLRLSSEKQKFSVVVNQGGLMLTNQEQGLIAKTEVPEVQIDFAKWGQFKGALNSHLLLNRQSLRILQLNTRLDNSEIQANGELTQFSEILKKPSGVLNIYSHIDLTDLYRQIHELRSDLKIPVVSGQVKTNLQTRFNGTSDFSGKADIDTVDLSVGELSLGNAKVLGNFKNHLINLSEISLKHPAGEALLTRAQIELANAFAFQARMNVKSLDLQKLFQTLHLVKIPVGVQLKGDVPCTGQFYPSFLLECENVTLNGQDLWVKSENKPTGTAIVNIDQLSAQGKVHVTPKMVSYDAKLNIGQDTGNTNGVIDFSKGFKINFKTEKLDFANVRNLANLEFKGSTSIEGSTEGNASTARFDMNLNVRNFIFEKYSLGNIISTLKLRSGHLLFDDLAGAIGRTQFIGRLDLNLNDKAIDGELSVPTAELADVAQVFSEIFQPPVTVSGNGSAKARFSGPLNFWKMNYSLDSAFRNVVIGNEDFDQLNFDVTAQQGDISTKNVKLTKGSSSLRVQGGINSQQVMDLVADGKNWRLEESNSVRAINTNITGNLNYSAELKSSVRTPQLTIKGAVTDTSLEEQDIPNSNFIFRINKDHVGGQLSLFGESVQGSFELPFTKGNTPLSVKMKTTSWNYSNLLALVGGANLASEYESSLSSTVDLHSPNGDIFKASGKIHLETVQLKRGPLSFVNEKPVDIIVQDGVVSLNNFTLNGPENHIQVRGQNFTAENMNISVNAKADLRLLQIFTPFLDDLGGPLRVSTTLSGPYHKPQILGSADFSNTFLKLKGFPHPIEKLSGEVLFSQSKILINQLKGQIAGGTLSGDGGITINGIRDLPTSIRLSLENVTFNVPEKVRSSGKADLLFSGRWFPFTLSGNYYVSNALVENEFNQGSTGTDVRQSIYLPKVLREKNFEPILLDLQINLDRNIIVRNSLIDGSVTGHLQVKGPPGAPLLFGKISTEKQSKLIFKDKVFDIQSGVIQFDDPDEVNPDLYISASSRIAEYDVSLIAQGPAKNLAIRLSSVPPLPEQDIISLIALGVTSSNLDQNVQSRQQAEQLGVEIGGAVLTKPINKQLESTLGLNLQVTSQYDSTRNISVPKLTLSRRLSDRVKVSGSRPIGDNQSYDLKMEYFLNSNLTAIGSFESRDAQDDTPVQSTQQESQSIFGIDLEFKREFK